MMLPYSRNEVASNDRNFELTALTIGKTSRKYLSGSSITNYPVLTTSTTRVVTSKVGLNPKSIVRNLCSPLFKGFLIAHNKACL